MALSMVHLLLARAWARGHEAYLECPEFYLGAISPDAMHVRFHNDKSHKDEFHLGNWGSVHVERVHEYWPRAFHALRRRLWCPRPHRWLLGAQREGRFSRSGRSRARCAHSRPVL